MPSRNTTVEPKGDAKRALIMAAALDLFRDQGFEKTTMREIASAAGVATGAAYYYFDSKEAIVLAFYSQSQEEMAPLLEDALTKSKDLRARLIGLIQVKLNYFGKSRRLMSALTGKVNPSDPLSPFSEYTRSIRESDIGFFAKALDTGKTKIPDDLRPHLPELLWLYQMGIVLYWIFDASSAQKKTQIILDKSAGLLAKLIQLSSFPLLRPLRRTVVDLVESVAP